MRYIKIMWQNAISTVNYIRTVQILASVVLFRASPLVIID